MNYLAHAFLSFNDEDIMIGNFVADHIRKAEVEKLPERIKQGVRLHRHIDYFTDTHPFFIKSKRHFYNGFERYSGVLTDIYYDHILAKNFERYSDVPLIDFAKEVYIILQRNARHLPGSAKRFLEYVTERNTFFEYSRIDGIELVLEHLSYRINHGVWLNESLPMFIENEKAIEQDFFGFMESLIKETKAFK